MKILFPLFFYVIMNIVQTWLILSFKLLKRGTLMIGGLELIEFPLIIWLIQNGGVWGFLAVVLTNIAQWLIIGIITIEH